MKCKIFKFYDDVAGESQINNWLEKEKSIQVTFINTVCIYNSMYNTPHYLTTIFYYTRKDKLENLKQLE